MTARIESAPSRSLTVERLLLCLLLLALLLLGWQRHQRQRGVHETFARPVAFPSAVVGARSAAAPAAAPATAHRFIDEAGFFAPPPRPASRAISPTSTGSWEWTSASCSRVT